MIESESRSINFRKNTPSKAVALTIAAIFILTAIPAPRAGSTTSPGSWPAVPSQCASMPHTNWLGPLVNAKMTIRNDEDAAPAWYWAIDNYQKSIMIWIDITSGDTYCALTQYNGNWATFAGALSPGQGAIQTWNAAGTFTAGTVATFTADGPFNPNHLRTFGSIGTYNFGGTKADLLLMPSLQVGDTSYVSYIGLYFGAGWNPASYTYLSSDFVYVKGVGVGYGNLWVSTPMVSDGNFGDIIATAHGAPVTPMVPTQCPGTGWFPAPVLNIRLLELNDEDSGFVGYWGLDRYSKSVVVWAQSGTNNYCALVQYSGTFTTYQGALSPQFGVAQSRNIQGRMVGGYVATFTSTQFRATKRLSGFIGTFDLGGSKSDVMRGTYGAGQVGNTQSVSWPDMYFANNNAFTDLTWAWLYPASPPTVYGNLWINAVTGSLGDVHA